MLILNRLRGCYYRLKYQYIKRKAIFGNELSIDCRLEICGPGKVEIGNNCYIGPDVFGCNYVTLYTHDSHARIKISDNVILRGSRFGCYNEIKIGACSIIESASISDSDFHNVDPAKRDEGYQEFNRPVTVEENSYAGMESLIGKGTFIGNNTVILPGSVLSGKGIRSNSVIAGLPARLIPGRTGRI